MPSIAKAGQDGATAQRLLDAAADEFARRGFVATRIRDIVESAGANLAAVNYHFGGKDGLYQATLAMLASEALGDLPTEAPAALAFTPEEQLRAMARVMLVRYLAPSRQSRLSRIIAHELLDPTPAFGQILRGVSDPQWTRLEAIVAALLGPTASGEDVALASLSVAGQWAFFLYGRRMFEFRFADLAGRPDVVDRLADHIAEFSVAALRARRLQLEGPGRRRSKPAAVESKRRSPGSRKPVPSPTEAPPRVRGSKAARGGG